MAKELNFRTIERAVDFGWVKSVAEFPLLGMKVGGGKVSLLGKDGEVWSNPPDDYSGVSFEVVEGKEHLVAVITANAAAAPPGDMTVSYHIKVIGPAKEIAKFQTEFAREQGYTVVSV